MLHYSVVDLGYMHNIPLKNQPDIDKKPSIATKLVWALHFTQDRLLLKVFLVQTLKYKALIFKAAISDKTSLELYDGPGIKSKNFRFEALQNKLQYISFETSTFQGVLYAYNHKISLSYTSQLNRQANQSSLLLIPYNHSEIIIFDSHKIRQEDTILICHIQTVVAHRVKLSNLDINYTGEYNSDTCSYAGLAAYEDEYETITICLKPELNYQSSRNKDLFVFSNIYSKHMTITLVFYHYGKYGNLSVEMTLSTTSCRPALINVCEVSNPKPFIDIFFTHMGEYSFDINAKQCLILQLGYYKRQTVFVPSRLTVSGSGQEPQRCEADIKGVSERKGKIKLNVTGFLRGKLCAAFELTEKMCAFCRIEFPSVSCPQVTCCWEH